MPFDALPLARFHWLAIVTPLIAIRPSTSATSNALTARVMSWSSSRSWNAARLYSVTAIGARRPPASRSKAALVAAIGASHMRNARGKTSVIRCGLASNAYWCTT
ncbi:MAG: hypothetical protein V4813_14050 [Gemmatimonadota bacterium]